MRTLKLTIAYDGTDFVGWQTQARGRTVQQTLERALAKITGEEISAAASGRTDSGVHALGQVVSFDTQSELTTEVLHRALNAELPEDVAVLSLEEAPQGFHARRDAKRKRYRYVIHDGRVPDVLRRRWLWHQFRRLDETAMSEAARALAGTHDFTSFETTGSPRASSVRTILDISVRRAEEVSSDPFYASPSPDAGQGRAGRGDLVIVEIEADGFLYNMVRAIVGTLIEVGRGTQKPQWPAAVLAAADRRAAGQTAPPQGLFLVRVDYD